MARRHELEIEISPSGEVSVTVKGAKGKGCLEYLELFQTLGEVVDQKVTSEYYEPDPDVRISDHASTRITE